MAARVAGEARSALIRRVVHAATVGSAWRACFGAWLPGKLCKTGSGDTLVCPAMQRSRRPRQLLRSVLSEPRGVRRSSERGRSEHLGSSSRHPLQKTEMPCWAVRWSSELATSGVGCHFVSDVGIGDRGHFGNLQNNRSWSGLVRVQAGGKGGVAGYLVKAGGGRGGRPAGSTGGFGHPSE